MAVFDMDTHLREAYVLDEVFHQDRVLMASDYPHFNSEFPGTV